MKNFVTPTVQRVTFEDILERDGVLVYTTRGVSMRPLLRQGRDVMMIEKPKEHWKKYDAVLFLRKNGQYVLHRILKVYPDRCWIVGDNCISGEMVPNDRIIGVMTSVKRNGRVIRPTDWLYRVYVRLWCAPYPVRFFLLRAKWLAFRGLRFVKRKLFG